MTVDLTGVAEDEAGTLELPAKPELVGLARLVVAALAGSRRDLPEDRLDDLKLAVSEACTNAVESYDEGAADPRVGLSWQEADDRIEVTVWDQGRGFDPDRVPGVVLEDEGLRLSSGRGLGIPLIRSLVDDASFTSGATGTAVRLTLFCGRAKILQA